MGLRHVQTVVAASSLAWSPLFCLGWTLGGHLPSCFCLPRGLQEVKGVLGRPPIWQ